MAKAPYQPPPDCSPKPANGPGYFVTATPATDLIAALLSGALGLAAVLGVPSKLGLDADQWVAVLSFVMMAAAAIRTLYNRHRVQTGGTLR